MVGIREGDGEVCARVGDRIGEVVVPAGGVVGDEDGGHGWGGGEAGGERGDADACVVGRLGGAGVSLVGGFMGG